MKYFICVFLYFSLFNVAWGKSGDELVVTGNIVNLRSGPSTDFDVILKLLKDRTLTELQQEGEWVQVNTGRKDVKMGWIHRSLVSKFVRKHKKIVNSSFMRFKAKFDTKLEVLKKQGNPVYFSQVKEKGAGAINLIATPAWLNAGAEQQGNSLNEMFKIWDTMVPVGSDMSVHVLDEAGEQHMLMLR